MSMKQLIAALRSGKQADVDGTTVIVSRQACEEAADALEARGKDPDDRRDDMPIEIKAWHSTQTLDHIGSWATTRYPEFTVAYVRKDSITETDPAAVVKPLSWGQAEQDGMNLQANCPFGRYYLALSGEYGWTWWRPSSGPAHMGIEPTEEAAKAAAQADYERRILAAITTHPTSEVRAEATAAALGAAADAIRALRKRQGRTAYPEMDEVADNAMDHAEDEVRELSPADATAWLAKREDDIREECAKIAEREAYGKQSAAAIRASKGGDA